MWELWVLTWDNQGYQLCECIIQLDCHNQNRLCILNNRDIYFLIILVAKSLKTPVPAWLISWWELFLACGSYLLLCAHVVSSLWEGAGGGVPHSVVYYKGTQSHQTRYIRPHPPPTMSSSEPNLSSQRLHLLQTSHWGLELQWHIWWGTYSSPYQWTLDNSFSLCWVSSM